MKQVSFIDGKIIAGAEASIPVDDLGLQRGYAVFDFARVQNGKIFHIHEHLARFRGSASSLHLQLRYTDKDIIAHALRLIDALGVEHAGLRLILTGGSAHADTLLAAPRFIMIAEELPTYPEHIYEKGVKLVTYEFQRDYPKVKTTNYMTAFRLEPLRKERHAFGILYVSQGRVLECPRDNFFIFRGDTLVTAADRVLDGITRRVIFDLARPHFEVSERDVAIEELDEADEALLSSTTKHIVPVVQIDDRVLGSGVVGERTRFLMERFREYLDAY